MTLLRSFAHNVIIHPLLFVRDVAERAGFHEVAVLIGRLHDGHELRGALQAVEDPDIEVPPQHPWTEEAAKMVHRPPIRPPPPDEPEPLAGSIASRSRRVRGMN